MLARLTSISAVRLLVCVASLSFSVSPLFFLSQAYISVHQRFDALLAEHNRLLSDFLSVLLAVRVKEAAQHQTMVHHLQAAVRCERVNYQLVKHEKPTLTLYIDQLIATATFAPDAAIDAVVEVKAVGGRVQLPHYLDQSRPEYAWQEMIQLYAPDKTADSAWRDVMLHAHFTGRFDRSAQGSGEAGEAVIRHLELNLHPIAVRITYEGIMLIVEYFVTEQQKMSKQSASYRDNFLPLSQAILDVDGDMGALTANEKAEREREKQLLGIGAVGSGSVPHSPKGDGEHRRKGMKDRMKGISHFFHRDKHSHSHSTSHAAHTGEADEELHYYRTEDDALATSASALAASNPTPPATASGVMLPRPIAPAPPHHHHSHSLSTSSSSGGGSSSNSVPSRTVVSVDSDDKSGLSLSVPPTPSSMASLTARKSRGSTTSTTTASLTDSERDAMQVQQRTDATSSTAATSSRKQSTSASSTANQSPLLYVQYMRLGASVLSLSYLSGGNKKYNIEDFQGLTVRVKPFTLQKRELTVEQLVRELRNQQLKALLRQVTATLGNFLSYKLGFSKPSGGTATGGQSTGGSASSSSGGGGVMMSSVDESREGDDEYDSDREGSAAGAPIGSLLVTSVDNSPPISRITLRSGLASVGVRALFGDKGKKRKDSEGRDVTQPTALQPQPISILAAPFVPPRPLSALLGAGSTTSLNTAGIDISAPVGASSGRVRSVSSGDRTDSRPSTLQQSASTNSLASNGRDSEQPAPAPAPAP